jgi:ferredoxin
MTRDTVVPVNELLKKDGKASFKSDKPFVFVCPTYAWRIPRVFESFIRETHFTGSKKAYFVMTCGGETGNAIRYIRKLCAEKGFELMGLSSVVMPENYIALFKVPDREETEAVIRKALPKIRAAAELIGSARPLPDESVNLIGRFYSTVVNPVFYPVIVHAKGFRATEACVGCGKCEKLCPLNNIKLDSGKPVWGGHCTHCMACICSCPAEAIEYKNNSKGKPRYLCPEID